jgi:ABC-type multidrug transport system fused ATPase/permease subunit
MAKLRKEKLYAGIRLVAGYLATYKKDMLILGSFSLVTASIDGAMPYVSGRLFDVILSDRRFTFGGESVPLYAGFLFVWAVLRLGASTVQRAMSFRSSQMSETIEVDYTLRGFEHLLRLPMSFHKKHRSGEINHRIRNAGVALSSVSQQILSLAPDLISVLVALAIIFTMNATLALIILAGIISYVTFFVRFTAPLEGLQKKMYDAYAAAWGHAGDAVSNVHAVKQVTSERHESMRLFRSFKRKAVPLWLRVMAIWQDLSFYQQSVVMLTQLAVFIISIGLIRSGDLTIGELVAFNAYTAMVFGPFVSIAQSWQRLQENIIAVERGEKILAVKEEAYHPANRALLRTVGGRITFDNVRFYYEKKKPILKGISFEAKPGSVVALVGESGVGKSTMIDLISGYHFARRGQVSIDGHNVKNIDLALLRSSIAVVPQEVVLFNDTIKNNIRYGNFKASDEAVMEAARKAHAFEFIEKFPKKWNQPVGERGVKLSGGQKQRLAIARAILRNPRILILDEPTSALDARSEHYIKQSLEELMAGRTTFIIAHRLSTVRKADMILVFKDGEIVERGTHEELLEKEEGSYKGLYEYQVGLHQ